MRLVDADKLTPRCMFKGRCDSGGGSRCDRCTDYAVQYQDIENAPTVQPEQRWIPVSERLPEKEGWYITTVESEKTGKRRIENDLFAVDIALAHGHTPNKFCKDGYKQKTVAWMPFPEPYQTERREDG